MAFFIDAGSQEYILTIGITAAFAAMLLAFALSRREIAAAFRRQRLGRTHALAALGVVALFLVLETSLVKPTQQLFFDDAIYQGGAQMLIRTGQAWMCNYGTPTMCFNGQLFHEPVGTSFNIAIGFLVGGVSRAVVLNEFIIFAALAVLLTFFAAYLLFGRFADAIFSELLMAFSPILLVWAAPTTSDLLLMFYSLFAFFAMLVFMKKKNALTLSFFAFSLAFLAYIKVNAGIYLILFPFMLVLLDETSVRKSVASKLRLVREHLLDTRLLLLAMVALLLILPEVMYVTSVGAGDDYGALGTQIQNTCGTGYINATGAINLQNFKANICSNILFWFNLYSANSGYPIMQPALFTLLGIIGAGILFLKKRREGAALAIWFAAIFLFYTAFYAGSVTFGVDWRFMLALVPPASLLGGYAIGYAIGLAKKVGTRKVAVAAVSAAAIAAIAYSMLSMAQYLSISPGSITQAATARFYENFVYDNARLVPSSCLVFSFDPTLFNINGRASSQFSNLTTPQTEQYKYYSGKYPCLVIDYGFWCYTTDDMRAACRGALKEYNTTLIAGATDNQTGNFYGLYRINSTPSSRQR